MKTKSLNKTPKPLTVDLWFFSLKYSQSWSQSGDFLSDCEQMRWQKIQDPKVKQHYLLTRFVLKMLIANYTNLPRSEINFNYNQHQKPFLKDHPWFFNLSHTNDAAVIVIARDVLVGVDIEALTRQAANEKQIAHKYFSKDEINYYQNDRDDQYRFLRLWTRKEAFTKAMGSGFTYPVFKDLSILAQPNDFHRQPWINRDGKRVLLPWRLHTFNYQEKYMVSTAIRETKVLLKVHVIDDCHDTGFESHEVFREYIV